MRRRIHARPVLLLIAALGAIAWLTLRPNEPVYQGKPLSQLLEQIAHPGLTYAETQQAHEGVRNLGTNTIPTLLKLLRTRDAPMTERFFAIVQRQHLIKVHHIPAELRRREGESGFWVLKAEGRDAVPALVELYGKEAPECRIAIAGALGAIGPGAKKAVPALIRSLGDTNRCGRIGDEVVVGAVAACVLGQIHSEPQLSVPALINCLTNQDPSMREQASLALREFGDDAKPAVPGLIGLLNDKSRRVKLTAEVALKQIDPEAAAKAGLK